MSATAAGVATPTGFVLSNANLCVVDTDCAGAEWCDTMSCVPKFSNDTAIPTVLLHVPTLDGTCAPFVGTVVCASGVCDSADDLCGFANGHGSCTPNSADGKCRSGVCGSDAVCGMPAGQGACTVASAGVLCRSGACSVDGSCRPFAGCNADGDCSGEQWCAITSHTCMDKISNGGALPSDLAHTSPVLDAHCRADAAALVCVSAVCDSDDKCGYDNGDGSCDAISGASVCRTQACSVGDGKCGYRNGEGPCRGNSAACCSGTCSAHGNVCVPVGGCTRDSECGANQ